MESSVVMCADLSVNDRQWLPSISAVLSLNIQGLWWFFSKASKMHCHSCMFSKSVL